MDIKTHDSLGRRNPYAKPLAKGELVVLNERDIRVFNVLDDHGILPSHYLYALTKHLGKDETMFKRRLTKLTNEYDGTKSRRYIVRPKQGINRLSLKRPPMCYENGPVGEEQLTSLYPPRKDPMPHRLMTGTTVASIRITCEAQGLKFKTLKDILSHPKCPPKAGLGIPTRNGILYPDDVFGIEYPEGFRFFALEADRSTEQHKDIEHKLNGYVDILANKQFEKTWGIPNLMVLIVTTRRERATNILKLVEERTAYGYRDKFLVRHKREFDPNNGFYVPPIMTDLFEEPWQRAGDLLPFGINKR